MIAGSVIGDNDIICPDKVRENKSKKKQLIYRGTRGKEIGSQASIIEAVPARILPERRKMRSLGASNLRKVLCTCIRVRVIAYRSYGGIKDFDIRRIYMYDIGDRFFDSLDCR